MCGVTGALASPEPGRKGTGHLAKQGSETGRGQSCCLNPCKNTSASRISPFLKHGCSAFSVGTGALRSVKRDVWDTHSETGARVLPHRRCLGSFLRLPAVTVHISHSQRQRQPSTAASLWVQCIDGNSASGFHKCQGAICNSRAPAAIYSDNPDPTKVSGHGTALLPGHAWLPAGSRVMEGTQTASLLGSPLRPYSRAASLQHSHLLLLLLIFFILFL